MDDTRELSAQITVLETESASLDERWREAERPVRAPFEAALAKEGAALQAQRGELGALRAEIAENERHAGALRSAELRPIWVGTWAGLRWMLGFWAAWWLSGVVSREAGGLALGAFFLAGVAGRAISRRARTKAQR